MTEHEKYARLERRFEGPEILNDLLRKSGSEHTVDDLRFEFEAALEEGTAPGEVIALLWDDEPHFDSPEMARRTFMNLFGLYDSIAAETGVFDLNPDEEEDDHRGLSTLQVESLWNRLEDLPSRDQKRTYNRFDNQCADILAFLYDVLKPQGDLAIETASELAFESWFILSEGYKKPLSLPGIGLLSKLHKTPCEMIEEPEPAIAALVHCTLYEKAADDESPLPEEAIEPIEAALLTVRRLLRPE